jgi:hypothetical protein
MKQSKRIFWDSGNSPGLYGGQSSGGAIGYPKMRPGDSNSQETGNNRPIKLFPFSSSEAVNFL